MMITVCVYGCLIASFDFHLPGSRSLEHLSCLLLQESTMDTLYIQTFNNDGSISLNEMYRHSTLNTKPNVKICIPISEVKFS